MKLSISVIVLTYNEEVNIERCLESIYGWVKNIFIVDSYSTDKTIEIAKKYTNQIYQHPFKNHAEQFNWALRNLTIETKWILRLDADEIVMEELQIELKEKLYEFTDEISGLYVKRRVYFLDRWIKHGGYYPIWFLRLWRKDKAYCEERWMDEHIKIIEGNTVFLNNDIIDYDKKNLHWWILKHNDYATREAIDILNLRYNILKHKMTTVSANLFGTQEQKKRWIKEKIYVVIPLFIRPFLYFIYRYFFKLGLLDGKEGLIRHFMHGFWYRFLVDSKIYEIEKASRKEKQPIKNIIKKIYNINLDDE